MRMRVAIYACRPMHRRCAGARRHAYRGSESRA
jgi:hypothetical protein